MTRTPSRKKRSALAMGALTLWTATGLVHGSGHQRIGEGRVDQTNSAVQGDPAMERWTALAKAWCSSVGAAQCKVTVAVQDGDLASDQSAAACVIAWDAVEQLFSLTQNALTTTVDAKRLKATRAHGDAAVDRAVRVSPLASFRQEIPESPWPQLAMALREPSREWWKNIDPELGEVSLKSFALKDEGLAIVMLQGKHGWLEMVFQSQSSALIAATRRVESGPRVPAGAAIEWRMTFEPIEVPAGTLSLDVGQRRRVERVDDLQSPPPAPAPNPKSNDAP